MAFGSEAAETELLGGELGVLTGASVSDPEVLAEQLAVARSVGYTLEDQESALGDAGVAAPVYARSGDVAGAIGVVGPVERLLSESRQEEIAVAVRETGRNLSRELGATRGHTRRAG